MKQFLKKILIAIVLCAILPILYTAAFFTFTSDALSMSYMAAMLDKVERLASIEEPKIILVGNSNLAFGIDSETIEEAYSMPVVNMGLHGGIGDALEEQIVKEYIGEGDIVVVALTHYDGTTSALEDATLTFPMMIASAKLTCVVLQNNLLNVGKALPAYILQTSAELLKGKLTYSEMYGRSSFNEYGDIAYERSESIGVFSEGARNSFDIEESVVVRLNEYNAYCESVGATMVVAGYPIENGEFTPSADEIDVFQSTLVKELDCAVIFDFTDYLMNYECFYNGYLHLNDEGAAIRTAQLIEDLQAVIP